MSFAETGPCRRSMTGLCSGLNRLRHGCRDSTGPCGRLWRVGEPTVGIWDWIANALMGGAGPAPSPSTEPDAIRSSTTEGGAVATLDAPPAPQAAVAADEPVSAAMTTEPWWAPEGVTRVEPVEVEPPELCTEARVLENLLVSQFDGHNLTLPPLPRVAERVLQRLRDRDCDLAEVANAIAEDQVIAGTVIRMANSPLYRGLHKVTALKPAVTRLGTTAIRTLMMHQSFRAATFDHKDVDQDLAAIVWYRSLAGAYVMRGLAAFTELDEEEAFLIGLLHDIGNVIVLRVVDDQRSFTDYKIDIDTFEHFCFECHQEFGELIADAWKLPASLRSLITNHHHYPARDDPLRTELLLLILTDLINQMLGYGPPVSYNLLETPTVRDLGLAGREGFITFLAQLPHDLEETLTSFGATAAGHASPPKGDAGCALLVAWLMEVRRGRTHDRYKLGRRRCPRWSSSSKEVMVWLDGARYPSLVRMLDLGEGGMGLRFPEPLDVGRRVCVGDESEHAAFEGNVVDVSPEPDGDGLYRIGIQFTANHTDTSGKVEDR